MSKLVVLKKIRIKTVNSFRITVPEAFILENDVRKGDNLIMFMADTGELVMRKVKEELPTKKIKK